VSRKDIPLRYVVEGRDSVNLLYYLEYDTGRAETFEPLLRLPAHKNAILVVITSKFPELEDKEKMKKRVHEAADIVAKGAGRLWNKRCRGWECPLSVVLLVMRREICLAGTI
jgi:hypothetical protein